MVSRAGCPLVLALGVLAAPLTAVAQGAGQVPSAAGIYTCTDGQGRRLTSDRPIADCTSREQRVLNKDGSVRQVVPPTLTPDERAEREATQRQAELARAAQADAVRRDRNLVARFPNDAAHAKAREAALDPVRMAMQATEKRVKELAAERKPLLDDAEFYKGRTLPARLKQQLDANDAAVVAQRQSATNQEQELQRINRLYDAELARLRLLWAGATPGSLPPAEAPARPAAPATAPTKLRPAAPSASR
ncbi:MAG TPA: DUF4124 domain-containing protein [Aquabacterium sp.]|nr:DUF4124 domain-containing protein [Aquabacterium sp.]